MAGPLLDNIYQSTYDEQMRSLLKSKVFGITLFGNGAAIHKVPIMMFLGSSPNNPFALLDIVDCTSELTRVGKRMLNTLWGFWSQLYHGLNKQKIPTIKNYHWGVVDLVLFGGASNVQNARKLVSMTYPCITVVHGAEHVVSLFFMDIFTKMPVFQCSSQQFLG